MDKIGAATFKCNDARNRHNVDCGGSRGSFRIPVNIGSPAMKRSWFNRGNPTYSPSTMPNTNLYKLITRVSRLLVIVSSTTAWNPSFSSIVATGSNPPYAVRFFPRNSYGVEAPILLGSEVVS